MKKYWRKNNSSMVDSPWSIVKSLQWTIDYGLWTINLLVAINCSQNKKQAQAKTYTCPMHPTVVQDKPGTCPVCGMDLVKKGKSGEEVKITTELNYLLKPTNAMVISSIKVITAVQMTMNFKMEAKGTVAHDTRKIATLSSRYNGRIEKLYVKYNLQPIYKGQKILEIYSPELITAQRELLYLLEKDA